MYTHILLHVWNMRMYTQIVYQALNMRMCTHIDPHVSVLISCDASFTVLWTALVRYSDVLSAYFRPAEMLCESWYVLYVTYVWCFECIVLCVCMYCIVSMCVCMYICMCACMFSIGIRSILAPSRAPRVYIYVCMYAWTCVCVYIYIHTYIHTYIIHKYMIRTHTYLHIHAYVLPVRITPRDYYHT